MLQSTILSFSWYVLLWVPSRINTIKANLIKMDPLIPQSFKRHISFCWLEPELHFCHGAVWLLRDNPVSFFTNTAMRPGLEPWRCLTCDTLELTILTSNREGFTWVYLHQDYLQRVKKVPLYVIFFIHTNHSMAGKKQTIITLIQKHLKHTNEPSSLLKILVSGLIVKTWKSDMWIKENSTVLLLKILVFFKAKHM